MIYVFHLIWMMSLHYLVKLEMFMVIGHMLPLSCHWKKLQSLFHPSCCFQTCQIWIQLITACSEYWKRRCTKYASVMWTNRKSDWEQSGPSWIMSSLWQLFMIGGVGDECCVRVGYLLVQVNSYLRPLQATASTYTGDTQ